MMHAPLAGADHGEAVVPPIDVEEVELVRLQAVVAHSESEQVAVEGQQLLHIFDVEYGVPHAERSRAEPRYRPARLERIACQCWAVKYLEPIASRILENNEVRDATLVGQCAGRVPHPDAMRFQAPRQRV